MIRSKKQTHRVYNPNRYVQMNKALKKELNKMIVTRPDSAIAR